MCWRIFAPKANATSSTCAPPFGSRFLTAPARLRTIPHSSCPILVRLVKPKAVEPDMEHDPKFSDTIVFESPLVRIGAFRCDRDYPGFQDTGPADNDCFVFPRTAVGIEHEHEPPFAANPNVVT